MAREAVIRAFFDEPTNTVSYLVADPATSQAAVIDPVLDYDIKANTGAKIGIGEHIRDVQRLFRPVFNATDLKTDGSDFDHLFRDSERFRIGEIEAEVLYTPGHTPADVTYKVQDAAFVGDTLFMPDYGTARADFPGGDAHQLYQSIRKVLALPPQTRLFMCHDYKAPGRDHYAWETTVARTATEQCPREGRRHRGRLRRDAHGARCHARGSTPDSAVDPGEHPGRQVPARCRQWCALSRDPGEIQDPGRRFPVRARRRGLKGDFR